MQKGIKLEVGKTYMLEVNHVFLKVLRDFKDERGNIWLKIKVKGENFEREMSSNLRLLATPLEKEGVIIIRKHSNSKEYTVHLTKDGGAIYFTKSKSNLRRWLKVRGWNLDDLKIEWVQH